MSLSQKCVTRVVKVKSLGRQVMVTATKATMNTRTVNTLTITLYVTLMGLNVCRTREMIIKVAEYETKFSMRLMIKPTSGHQ